MEPSDLRVLGEGDLQSHALFVRRLARRLVRDEPLAEDVAQETWRSALAHPPLQVRSWRGWLSAAARNAARQLSRSANRRDAHEQRAAARERLPSAADVAMRLEAERRLIDAVAALDEADRALVLLRHFDGLAPREIARRMHAPVETVKTRLKRALERLRERLVVRGDGDRTRLHSGLLLIANGLVAKVGGTGALVAGGLWMSAKGKLVVVVAAAVVIGVSVRLAAPFLIATGDDSSRDREVATAAVAGIRSMRGDDAKRSPADSAVVRVEDSKPTQPAELDPSASRTLITGRFVDIDGHPLANVDVHCPDEPDRWWPPRRTHELTWPATKSGEDGRFTWRRPSGDALADAAKAWGSSAAPGGWADALVVHLDACRAGYVRQQFEVAAELDLPIDVGELVLQREGRVCGRVELPTGFANATALVAAVVVRAPGEALEPRLDAPEHIVLRTETGADGRFELAGLATGLYQFWTVLPRGLYTPAKLRPLVAGQTIDDLVLQVDAPCTAEESFAIDVERPDGSPLPQASLFIGFRRRPGSGAASLVADSGGHADVPARGITITSIEAIDPEHRLLPASLRVENGIENPCVLKLGEAFRIAVQVRGPPHVPFRGAFVVADTDASPSKESKSAPDRFSASTKCGPDGRCELWVPDRPISLTAQVWGFKTVTVGPLLAREQTKPVEIVLECAPALTGRVVCAGEPVAGAALSILRAGSEGDWILANGVPSIGSFSGSFAEERTDEIGRFRVGVSREGRILLRAHAVGFAPAAIGPLEIVPGESRDGLEIELTHGGAIAGRVLPGSDGTLARIVVFSNGDGLPRSWRVAEDGTFTLDHLTPGRFNVRVNDEPIPLLSFRFDGEGNMPRGELPWNCVVRDGETTTLTISSDDTLACVVHGTIDGLGQNPANWRVSLVSPTRADSRLRNELAPRIEVGGDGRFEVRRSLPGPCHLEFWPATAEGPGGAVTSSFRFPLELSQGIRAWHASLTLGRLEGDASALAAGRVLVVEAAAETADGFAYQATASLGVDGRFVFALAPAGEVRVRIAELGLERTLTVTADATTQATLR